MIYRTKNPKETEKLAGFLFEKIQKGRRKKATVIALEGELGAGKTMFVRGLARALKIKVKIKSPTFNLMKSYKSKDIVLYHFDCYRLKDHRDLGVFGIKEILADPQNLVLIEWSDRVKKILPRGHVRIHIDHIGRNERKIAVSLR